MMNLLCCSLALLFAVAAGQGVPTCSDVLTAGSYVASYSADGDSVEFNVSVPTTGWVAIGFSPNQAMPNTDVVLGASDGALSFINDRFAGSRSRPPIDASQDITAASAELMDGTTTIRFTRPRVSTDTNDITLDQCRFFLWAWGGSVTNGDPTTIGRHSSRGSFPNMVCIPDNCVNGELPPDCGPLDAPDNGQISLPTTTEGSVATYSCDTGYNLVGNAMRTCQANETWTGSDPTCEIVTCPELMDPANGAVDDSNREFQNTATYTCDTGFELLGNSMRTCQADGTWSGDEPTCMVLPTCSDVLTAGSYVASFSADGDSVEFNVSVPTTGWVAIGFSPDQAMPNTDVVLGASDGALSFINDRFAGSRTRPPIDPSQDITAASAELMDGTTTIRFTRPRASTDTNDISLDQCRFFLWAWGGSVTNGDPTTIGQHTSRGIFPNMVCIPDNCVNGELVPDCGPLDAPDNGQISLPTTTEGSVATYSCDTGYNLVGNTMRTCQANETWTGSDPTCEIVTCPELMDPANGAVDDSNREFQDTATYTCDTGFELFGNSMRTCQADGTWSGDEPTCRVPTCSDVLTAGSYVASFSADGDSVEFNISVPTTGWVAIGFSPDQAMPNTDVVLGASDGALSFINDRFAGSRTRPPIDASQDITAASAELMDGTTTIRFTRPRVSTDTNDITLDQCRFFLWAWGGSVTNGDPTTIGQHSSRGIFPNMVCIPDNCVNGVAEGGAGGDGGAGGAGVVQSSLVVTALFALVGSLAVFKF